MSAKILTPIPYGKQDNALWCWCFSIHAIITKLTYFLQVPKTLYSDQIILAKFYKYLGSKYLYSRRIVMKICTRIKNYFGQKPENSVISCLKITAATIFIIFLSKQVSRFPDGEKEFLEVLGSNCNDNVFKDHWAQENVFSDCNTTWIKGHRSARMPF